LNKGRFPGSCHSNRNDYDWLSRLISCIVCHVSLASEC
jgi:hypothetical protein